MNKVIREKGSGLPYAAAAMGNLIWGFSNTLTQVALYVALPSVVLSVRFLSAILVMSLLIISGKEKLNLKKPHLFLLFCLGVVELIYFYCESYGIMYTNVTCSGVILAASPIVSTAFAAIFIHEIPIARQVLFSIVAVAGVIMITVSEGIEGEIQPVGVLLLMGGCICSAVFRIINRKIVSIYTAFERTYMVLLVSAVSFTTAAVFGLHGDYDTLFGPIFQPAFLIPVLSLGLFSSVGANLMVNYAAEKLPVVKLSVFGTICTLCSMTGGVFFLHEPVNALSIMGVILIVTGIWQVNK